jgi:hypothetical protein
MEKNENRIDHEVERRVASSLERLKRKESQPAGTPKTDPELVKRLLHAMNQDSVARSFLDQALSEDYSE